MPELRKDPIVGRWVIIATERGKRPSDFGRIESPRKGGFCPFCPGNESKTPPEVFAMREVHESRDIWPVFRGLFGRTAAPATVHG